MISWQYPLLNIYRENLKMPQDLMFHRTYQYYQIRAEQPQLPRFCPCPV